MPSQTWNNTVGSGSGSTLTVAYDSIEVSGGSARLVNPRIVFWSKSGWKDSTNSISAQGTAVDDQTWTNNVLDGGNKVFSPVASWVGLSYGGTTSVDLTAKVHGVSIFNGDGATTYHTLNAVLPARAPELPRRPPSASVTRNSDTSHTVAWTTDYTGPEGGYPWHQVEVQRWDNVSNAWYQVAVVPWSTTSWVDTSTVGNRRYRWRVRSINTSGASAWTSATPADTWTTPAAATGVSWTVLSSGQVQVSWTNPATAAAEVRVLDSEDGGTPVTIKAGLGGSATSWETTTAPDPTKTHTYRVMTLTSNGLSATSEPSAVLQLQAPPLAPTKLGPVGTQDAAAAVLRTWQHNPADGSPQSAYEVTQRTSSNGGASWTAWASTGKITSVVSSRSQSWATGTRVQWQVRTWGAHADPGAWSAIAELATGTRPSVTLDVPATLTASTLVVAWVYYDPEGTSQVSAQVEVLVGGTTIASATLSGTASSWTMPTPVADLTTHTVRVRVRDGSGLWSTWATQSVTTAFVPPPAPDVEVAFVEADGTALIQITNPTPRGNLAPNPSFESGADGVLLGDSIASIWSGVSDWAAADGERGLRITGTPVPTASDAWVMQVVPDRVEGERLTFSCVARNAAAGAAGEVPLWARIAVQWRAGATSILSTTYGPWTLLTRARAAEQPRRVVASSVAPATTTQARVMLQFAGDASAAAPPADFVAHTDAWRVSHSIATTVSVVGDSLVRGYTGGTAWAVETALPAHMQTLVPASTAIINRGWGGRTVDEVRILWPSVRPRFAVAGGGIPASGSVALTAVDAWGMQASGWATGGSLGGVPGQIAWSGSAWTFTRTSAGEQVDVGEPVEFISSRAFEADSVCAVIWAGRNDINQQITGGDGDVVAHVLASIERLVGEVASGRYLVIPPMNQPGERAGTPGYTQVRQIEEGLRARYGDRCLDIRAWFVSQAIHDLGLTPTADDLADMAADAPPRQITDWNGTTILGSHYVPAVAPLIARRVVDRLTMLGELPDVPYVAGGETVPAVSNRVDRSVDAGASWQLVADQVPVDSTITDRTPLTHGTTLYRVSAISATPTTAPTVAPLDVRAPGIYLTGGPGDSLTVHLDVPGIVESDVQAGGLLWAADRALPVSVDGIGETHVVQVSEGRLAAGCSRTDWDRLRALIRTGGAVLYRDVTGQRWRARLSGLQWSLEGIIGRVAFTATQIDDGEPLPGLLAEEPE